MIRTLPNPKAYTLGFKLYIILYFSFLFAPLLVTCVLAFNDSQFPALPWKGFSLDWFFANKPSRVGIFHDQINLASIWVSARVAFFVTIFSTTVGTCAAFLFEQEDFRFKQALYFLMIAPLVIPGVILGISILVFSNSLGLSSISTPPIINAVAKGLIPPYWVNNCFTAETFLTRVST